MLDQNNCVSHLHLCLSLSLSLSLYLAADTRLYCERWKIGLISSAIIILLRRHSISLYELYVSNSEWTEHAHVARFCMWRAVRLGNSLSLGLSLSLSLYARCSCVCTHCTHARAHTAWTHPRMARSIVAAWKVCRFFTSVFTAVLAFAFESHRTTNNRCFSIPGAFIRYWRTLKFIITISTFWFEISFGILTSDTNHHKVQFSVISTSTQNKNFTRQ